MLSFFNLLYTFISLAVLRIIYEHRRDRSLPPGPRRLPLIGNLLQAPREFPWLLYNDWAKKYGPIFSVQYGGNLLIFVANAQIARNLLSRRNTSNRPRMVMVGENLTKGMHILLRPYSERYRLHQKMEAPVLRPQVAHTYYPIQDLESKQLLIDFLHQKDKEIRYSFERYSASLMYSLAYGFRVTESNPWAMDDAHRVMENFAIAGRVGTWIVDAIPLLNYLPECVAPWKKLAKRFYQLEADLHTSNMEAGLTSKSWNWTKEFTKSKEATHMTSLELAYNMGILADAGLETTAIVMEIFILACLAYPSFIPVAHEELDRVVGPDRLPTLEDKLPYIEACVKEVLRWRAIIRTGVPHATLEEDTYLGYRIPKDATIVPLFWSINTDAGIFENPHEFHPERWIGKTTESPYIAFGYGRRICTGRHIAKNSLFLLISRLLWGFNIHHATDDHGIKLEVDDMAFTDGLVSKPRRFRANFEPRSEQAKAVIEKEWNEVEKDIDVVMSSISEQR